jgi:glycosyltransferase involved in cell wall biosynthesis
MTARRRIAFYINLDGLWTGGLLYYENLLRALRAVVSPSEYELLALLPKSDPAYTPFLQYMDEVHILHEPTLLERATNAVLPRIPQLVRDVLPLASSLSRCALRFRADVLFLKVDPGPHCSVPTLTWFPDFQYLHYPEMFSSAETAVISTAVRGIAKHSSRVLLNSQAVRGDFARTIPEYLGKTRVVPFVSIIDESVYARDPYGVCKEYHLPEKFFYLPNQIWKHKNHQTVLSALTLARRRHPDITVVSTGLFSDYRNPRFSSELLGKISRSGNREHFICLGLVPREHLYDLMRQSLALLQPSLFEGWSTTVEEAKSLGKAVLLSDLPVHHEQNPPSAEYFPPMDSEVLAEKMVALYTARPPGPDRRLEQSARQNLASRVRQFGESFLAVVAEIGR